MLRSATLELIVGPMTAGKSTDLQRQYRRQVATRDPERVLVVKPVADTRDPDGVRTHDGRSIECVRLHNLKDIDKHPKFAEAHVVLVDEAQFFSDVVEGVKLILKRGKKTYVYALDGDRNQKPFGEVCNLLPLCIKITKLTAICTRCGEDAPFTISDDNMIDDEQLVPGGTETYSAVCQECLNRR